MLDGDPELRTPGRHAAPCPKAAWSGSPPAPAGAHRLRNTSDTPARYVPVSTMVFPEVAEQIDTGTILAMSEPGTGWPPRRIGRRLRGTHDGTRSKPTRVQTPGA